jgi:DNA-directed RNA polymerase specialized sigma24 family protein
MSGSPQSLEALLDDSAWLDSLARSLVLDESRADDVVQDAWLSTVRRPPPLLTRAWLAGVVRNLARLTYRKDSARRRHERLAARSRRKTLATRRRCSSGSSFNGGSWDS